MSCRVEVIDANESVQAAAERMRVLDVGSLPVTDAGRVVGIVTDRDLVVRVLARGAVASAPVRTAMTAEVKICLADEDVTTAAATMARAGVRRLLVVDRDLQPVGLLSIDDLALHGCAPDLLASVLAHPA